MSPDSRLIMEEHIGSLTVVGFEELGILAATVNSNGSVKFVSGLSFLVLQDLQFILNFTTRNILVHDYFPAEDNIEVSRINNDSLAYHILIGNADIAVGWLYQLKHRLQYGIPLISFYTERYEAYFIQPSEKVSSKFAKPFHTDLIVCFVVTIFTVSVLCTSFNDGEFLITSIRQTFYDGFFLGCALICQKEFKVEAHKTGAKLTLLIGTLLALFVYLLYSSAILSYFLVDFNVIQSFSDIFKHPFSMCASPGLESIILPTHKGGLSVAHSQSGTSSSLVTFPKMENSESLKRLFSGKHVHLGTHDDIGLSFTDLGIPHYEVCQNISYVKIPGSIPVGFYARKSFKHRNIFNAKLVQLRERGLIMRYRFAFKSDFAIRCPKTSKQYDEDLGLAELQLPFMFLICGALCSFLFLFIEVALKHPSMFNCSPRVLSHESS